MTDASASRFTSLPSTDSPSLHSNFNMSRKPFSRSKYFLLTYLPIVPPNTKYTKEVTTCHEPIDAGQRTIVGTVVSLATPIDGRDLSGKLFVCP